MKIKNPQTGEETGIKLPYIVTIEEGSQEILSIRRNYDQMDPLKKKKQYPNTPIQMADGSTKKIKNIPTW